MKSPLMFIAVVLLFGIFIAGCERSEPVSPHANAPALAPQPQASGAASGKATLNTAGPDLLTSLNEGLASRGEKFRVGVIEYVTSAGSGEFGATIFAKNVGNKQLGHHFVSGDPRRGGGSDITYIVDVTEGNANGGIPNAQTEQAIDHAMNTWDQESATPSIVKTSLGGPVDLGYVQFLQGFGGVAGWAADITHAGWLPGAFFDAIAPGGSASILGVTFTFLWVDGDGNLTDIDGDKKYDVAFREIYYNNAFTWSVSGPDWSDPEVDVETIALHESGHGLSQGHFGQIFNDGKGTKEPGFQLNHLHFSPRAVMNAIYWDTQRSLLGTDHAGYSSIWQSWK